MTTSDRANGVVRLVLPVMARLCVTNTAVPCRRFWFPATVAWLLVDGETRVVSEMVDRLEAAIDDTALRFAMPTEFVIPGNSPVSAALDLSRTIVRRAERESLRATGEGSLAVAYQNRLSDLLWALARWQENASILARRPG